MPAARLLLMSLPALLLAAVPCALAFDFNDLEKVEKMEQEDLLAKAGAAARAWHFSDAQSFLQQARQKGYAPAEIKQVEALIASNQAAKADKDRREEEARIAAAKAEEERQRAVAASSSSSSGGGSRVRYDIRIEVEMATGLFTYADNFRVWPAQGFDAPSAEFKPYDSHSGALWPTSFNRGLAGVYNYSVVINHTSTRKSICTGQFRLNGRESGFHLDLYDSCRISGTRSY